MAAIDLGVSWANGVWEAGAWADGVWSAQEPAGGRDGRGGSHRLLVLRRWVFVLLFVSQSLLLRVT